MKIAQQEEVERQRLRKLAEEEANLLLTKLRALEEEEAERLLKIRAL